MVKDLIDKDKRILEDPDKPKFLDSHVSRLEVGGDDTKMKAQERLKLLQGTKEAWVGCAENNDTVIVIRANTAAELELLSQGEKVSEDAQAHKGELGTVTKYGISCTRYKLCDKYKRRQFSRLEAAQT